MLALLSLAPLSLALLFPAQAAVIPGVYNTGVDSAGTVLADGAAEQHYRFATSDSVPTTASGPASSLSLIVMKQTNPSTATNWTGDGTVSAWIGPDNPDRGQNPPGRYYYSTTFDLTGFDPSTAVLTGFVSADDVLADIRLNTTQTGITNSDPADRTAGYTRTSMFTISSGFVSGVNFLEFRVDNALEPTTGAETWTGFRVQLSGTANLLAVPEPMSAAVLLAGVMGLGLVRRRVAA